MCQIILNYIPIKKTLKCKNENYYEITVKI